MRENHTSTLTIWEENNIPPLEYCSVHRAAKLLKCDEMDLICWASDGYIEPTFLIKDFPAAVMSTDHDLASKLDVYNFMNKHLELFNKDLGSNFPLSWPFRLIKTTGAYIELYTSDETDEIDAENIRVTDIRDGITAAICSISGLWTVVSLPVSENLYHQLLLEESIVLDCEEYMLGSTMMEDVNPTCIAYGLAWEKQTELEVGIKNCFIKRIDLEKLHSKKIDNNHNTPSGFSASKNRNILQSGQQRSTHMNKERFATNREALLKSAIYLLSEYPDECRGGKKEISAEKWADCIFNHEKEIPPLTITNRETVIKKLREALNGNLTT